MLKTKGKRKTTKMSEQRTKSNAPWILGIVGLILTVVHTACAVICTAAVATIDKNVGASEEVAQGDMNQGMTITLIGMAIMAVCFILSFFGKSKASGLTGMLLIIGGIAAAGVSIAHLSVGGIAAGIVYMCAGISSICNRKKIKA